MKAASFNVNSVRARLPIVLDWLRAQRPDVLCLQETKAQDKDFPADAFADAGYQVAFRGEKSYNGVAIVSKEPLEDVDYGLDGQDEARLIRGRLGDLHVVNTYVPQGHEVGSDKWQYKLEWFGRLGELFRGRYKTTDLLLWMGDLNVAPEDRDVYDPERLAGEVCFHPDEQAALQKVKDWGFVDVFRRHCDEAKQFSFFDYRMPKAVERRLGWRLDHILATGPLTERSTAAYIDLDPRVLPKPSDHTPIVAEFRD